MNTITRCPHGVLVPGNATKAQVCSVCAKGIGPKEK